MMRNFNIEDLDGNSESVETGAVVFGNDWPGLFISGNYCLQLVSAINHLINYAKKSDSKDFMLKYNLSILTDIVNVIESEVLQDARKD